MGNHAVAHLCLANLGPYSGGPASSESVMQARAYRSLVSHRVWFGNSMRSYVVGVPHRNRLSLLAVSLVSKEGGPKCFQDTQTKKNPKSSRVASRMMHLSSSSSSGEDGNIPPPVPPPDSVEIRFRRGSRRRSKQQLEDGIQKPPPPPKEWESMTINEKAVELYMGEKGLLFWLNKFAYASIFIIIGAWILFRFVGPSLGLYQLDSAPLSPTSVLKT
ncbi:hypothetical protein HHK36_026383 [Tetracentron sinense]|uniref:Uncharacterized protein n=1 Tax=Tetracentron sinense TaxID=13715 RepID=A0A834YFY6_TETSI|nr:hypothetical protein HHK36_026383 [Tetracentron sinense]